MIGDEGLAARMQMCRWEALAQAPHSRTLNRFTVDDVDGKQATVASDTLRPCGQ